MYAKLANFRMWNKALTASEVASYKDNTDPSLAGTVAFYPLASDYETG
jgi:hypothetical protein